MSIDTIDKHCLISDMEFQNGEINYGKRIFS